MSLPCPLEVFPAPWVIPDLACMQYKAATSSPLEIHPMPPTETQTGSVKAWRRTFSMVENLFSSYERDSHLVDLPPDLLLMIVSQLSDASVASLALTCKGMLSFFSVSSVFCKLQLPPEQPGAFRDPELSKTQVYQVARWEFLHLLERDLKGKWYLCSECFTLHPPQMFKWWTMPTLMNCYSAEKLESRTCRHKRQKLCQLDFYMLAPTGIVDLCPCIKLTIGKKRQLEARLREDAWKIYANDRPAADFWWHVSEGLRKRSGGTADWIVPLRWDRGNQSLEPNGRRNLHLEFSPYER